MPPASMAALCTGPVTMPSTSPRPQASAAARRAPVTLAALAGSGIPNSGMAGWGTSTRRARPGPLPSSASGRSSTCAARRSVAPSPNTVMSAPWSRCSAITHSSGPTPAGSPGTSARRGRATSAAGLGAGTDPAVDVGLAAHLAQEALPLVFHLALADALADGRAALFILHLRLARRDPLDHVPTGVGAEWFGHIAVLERRQLGAELGAEVVGAKPAQVAASVRAARILRGLFGHGCKVLARHDACAQRLGPGPGFLVLSRILAAADEDVARVVLRTGDRRSGGSGVG